jgi:hypothetical protein
MKFSKLAIYLNYGKKGAGKSLVQAADALSLFASYKRSEKRYPHLPKRIYFGNQKFNAEIEEEELGEHLFYWSNAKQLRYCPRPNCWISDKNHPVHDTDIGHDEIGKDLPAGSWTDTPKWFRQIFSHLRKRGNRYFANTQVYEDIDISFRRQIDFAWHVEKIFGTPDITATRPQPSFVFGVISRRQFDPMLLEWERDPNSRERKQEDLGSGWPDITFIRKRYVNAYDTKDEIPAYKPETLEHIELWCEDPNCEKHGFAKRADGAKPKVEHFKI